MNFTSKLFSGIAIAAMSFASVTAQDAKETVQDLSKKAVKGFMYDASKDANGVSITYKIKGDKKADAAFFEKYTFDASLKLADDKEVSVPKEDREDYEQTVYYASVGGCSSFDILSMKLKLTKSVRLKTWSHESQKYIVKKYISSETIKAKNDDGKVYYGYATYMPSDEKNAKIFTLAKVESKDKGVADKFYILFFDDKLEIKETAVPLTGSYTLVYSSQIANDDVILVFAPQKGNGDVSKYIYFQYDISGTLKNKVEFASPAPAMMLTASYSKDGNVFLCGSSIKSKGPYDEEFKEYAPIENPCFKEGNNKLDMRWIKASEQKMDNFHILQFRNDQLVFASTVPISEFKSKFKTAPHGKGADPYKGKKFDITKFYVTQNGDFLIAGQLTGTVHMGASNVVKSYEDIVCLHFDKSGGLKAQYGVEKLNNDKKSEIFGMNQNFYPSADGKSIYWEILEVKGEQGYADFMDAMNGNTSYYSRYFPRIGKIDLDATSVSDFKILGEQKYFLNKHFTGVYDEKQKEMLYIGHDAKFKKLWLAKVALP